MEDYIHKHLEKKYGSYQQIIDMDFSPVFWIRDMFGIDNSIDLWVNWCRAKYGHVYEIYVESDDSKRWYKDGVRHRDGDLPAMIFASGSKEWYQHGERHRDNDKPAYANLFGDNAWFKNGQRHRDNDLPAIVDSDGRKCWFKNGQRHRAGGLPAIEYVDGTKEWFKVGNQYTPNN